MTKVDELTNDCQKFCRYLEANGVTTTALHLLVEMPDGTKHSVGLGARGISTELCLHVLGHFNGFELRAK
jgi:hypothetical protein